MAQIYISVVEHDFSSFRIFTEMNISVNLMSRCSGLWRRVVTFQYTKAYKDHASSIFKVSYRNTTRRQNPENLEMNLHHRENLKSCNRILKFNTSKRI
jgi:hypothetical protein